jgi:hypothetical protein
MFFKERLEICSLDLGEITDEFSPGLWANARIL